MKGMILAAGLGTRLQPLTLNKPKALVEIGGTTMLEMVVKKLIHCGVESVIINVHHFADMIGEFLRKADNFGIDIELSHEPHILGTGGGIKNVAWFFNDNKPFFVHNVDVFSDLDLEDVLAFHINNSALATLVVQQRRTKRTLVIDAENRLRGRQLMAGEHAGGSTERSVAFNGIHVISPSLFPHMSEEPPFSIIDLYVRLAAAGERIVCYDMGDRRWWDLGKHETLIEAQNEIAEGNGRR